MSPRSSCNRSFCFSRVSNSSMVIREVAELLYCAGRWHNSHHRVTKHSIQAQNLRYAIACSHKAVQAVARNLAKCCNHLVRGIVWCIAPCGSCCSSTASSKRSQRCAEARGLDARFANLCENGGKVRLGDLAAMTHIKHVE